MTGGISQVERGDFQIEIRKEEQFSLAQVWL